MSHIRYKMSYLNGMIYRSIKRMPSKLPSNDVHFKNSSHILIQVNILVGLGLGLGSVLMCPNLSYIQ